MDKKEIKKAQQDYTGADIDAADDNKVTEKMVEAEVKELNNNPRNEGE